MFVANKCYASGELIIECQPLVHILFEEQKSKRCDYCMVGSESLKKCSQCKKMYYCDQRCQKIDWKFHKNECQFYQTHYHQLLENINKLLLRVALLIKHNSSAAYATVLLPDGSKRSLNDLESHYYDIISDGERKSEIESIIDCFNTMRVDGVSDEGLIKLYGILVINAYGINIRDHHMSGYEHCGSGLYIVASALDHSCSPNVTAIASGNRLQIKALKQIKIGDELFASYIDTQLPKSERIALLKSRYYFECKCYRCEFDVNAFSDAINNDAKSYRRTDTSSNPVDSQRYDPNITFSLLEKLKIMLENSNNEKRDNNNNADNNRGESEKIDINECIASVRDHIIVAHGQHHCMYQLFSSIVENSSFKQSDQT